MQTQTHTQTQQQQMAGKALMDLENKFWQSMVDEDTDTAVALLTEPAVMVSQHGAMSFDHATYRRMAEQGPMVIRKYAFSDMQAVFPNDDTAILTYRVQQTLSPRGESRDIVQNMADSSVWTRQDGQWRCVMHTETPVDSQAH
jgi:hypothetical protein